MISTTTIRRRFLQYKKTALYRTKFQIDNPIKISLFTIFLLSAGCSGVQTDRAYQELGRAEHFRLGFDGYIIGFEKRKLNDSEWGQGYKNKEFYHHLVKPLSSQESIAKKRNVKFNRYTQQNIKIMMPTQIVRQVNGFDYIYNAYANNPNGEYNYSNSVENINGIFNDISKLLTESKLNSIPYTHIFVMSMGWNNDQVESIRRYRKILEQIKEASTENTFHPLVIGITWPSVWSSISSSKIYKKFAHIISYPNKTNDADELGITWLNWIINQALPAAIEKADIDASPKVVLLGHSLGARLLGTALFSSKFLVAEHNPSYKHADMFIGLQGAFSARRFVENEGLEGHPYSDFNELTTQIVMTSSKTDKANPVAHKVTGASHIGGSPGIEYANNNPEIFEIISYQNTSFVLANDKVNLIDASQIVTGDKTKGISSHNDILDGEMGLLISRVLGISPES